MISSKHLTNRPVARSPATSEDRTSAMPASYWQTAIMSEKVRKLDQT